MTDYKPQNIYFGTENYPLIERDENQYGARMDNSNPVVLSSTQEAPEGISLNDYIYGKYIRGLSTRSLIPAINQEFDSRNQLNPNSTKMYASGFLGAPGTGKTFFFSLLGDMSHKKGPLLVDCSDKDLQTLFAEPVFDTSSADMEKAAIDSKIKLRNMRQEGGLSDKSLELLKNTLGNAYTEDQDGMISIDWNAVELSGEDLAQRDYQAKVLEALLKEVCQNEHITPASSNSLSVGIKMRDGELFRVFDPNSPDYGRPIILDELNRAKHGTLDNLYGLLNFLNSPNLQTMILKGANGRELKIDKNKIPSTFYLNFTGNQAIEGMGSQGFNDPFLSRVPEGLALKTIPDTTPMDYADMIAGYLMGVPALLINDAFPFKNEKELVSFLKVARTIGLTEQQKAEIPEWQHVNIENAGKMMEVSRRMGQFFYEIKQLTRLSDQEKERLQLDLEMGYEELLKRKTIDFRTIHHFFIQADRMKGTIKREKPLVLGGGVGSIRSRISKQERYASRGNRLEAVLKTWLKDMFIPADLGLREISPDSAEKLYRQALQKAYECKIFKENLKEAAQKNTLADFYNVKVLDPDETYQNLREMIVAALQQEHPELLNDSAEDILPISVVEATIKQLSEKNQKDEIKTLQEADRILTINDDPDMIGTRLLKPVSLQKNEIPTQDLVSANQFFMSIVLPGLKSGNLKTLFKDGIGDEQDDSVLGNIFIVQDKGIKKGVLAFYIPSQDRVWIHYPDKLSENVLKALKTEENITYFEETLRQKKERERENERSKEGNNSINNDEDKNYPIEESFEIFCPSDDSTGIDIEPFLFTSNFFHEQPKFQRFGCLRLGNIPNLTAEQIAQAAEKPIYIARKEIPLPVKKSFFSFSR